MARDKSHSEQVERWANFVRDNPRKEWIKHLKPFIDGQIIKANNFFKELAKTKQGREKIRLLKKLRPEYKEKLKKIKKQKGIHFKNTKKLKEKILS